MHGFKGERVLMRIHVEEQDRCDGGPVYECIVDLLRRRRFAGATVFRGRLGFGAGGRVHEEHAFSIREDTPIIIECIDTEEKVKSVLPEIDRLIGGGLITLERVRVVMYRHDVPAEDREASERIDITGSWQVTERPLDPGGPREGGR